MKPKILVALLLLGVVVAGAMLTRSCKKHSRTTDDFPDGMHWQCVACQHGFSTPREEFAAWSAEHDERLPCPECGENTTAVAQRCPLPDCGAYHVARNVVIEGEVCCPVCRLPIP